MPTSKLISETSAHARKAILAAGFVTGILDALAAMIQGYFNEVRPEQIWKYVASGAVGDAAFSGGAGMVVLGMFCHFLVAIVFTTLFFYLYPYIRRVLKNIYITGMLWGLVVWAVMHFVVMPLSGTPPRRLPFNLARAYPSILIHLFVVGLPMALVIHRFYGRSRRMP